MTRLYANTSVSTITVYIMCLFLFTHPCLSTGKGTTHCTNGIVVQRKPHTCALPSIAATNRVPSKKRSVNFVASDVLHFISSSRQGPGQLNIDVNKLFQSQFSINSQLIDFGWRLCRQSYLDGLFDVQTDQPQVIPAWSAFNTLLQDNKSLRECSIGYCDVIDACPTELPTVYRVLERFVT